MGPSPPFAPQGLPIREYLLVGLCAAVVTFLITGVIRRLAIRAGAIAVPRGRDVHTVPIPRLGGVAMYIGVLAGVFVASQLPVLRRAFDYSSETRAVMVAGGLIVLVGALDDRFGIDALTKLAGQATSAGVLVLLGVQWFVLPIPDGSDGSDWTLLILDPNQGVVLTVFLCVVLVNAVNFVDGLDGLAAGIGLIASSAILAFSLGLLEQRGGDVTAYPPALIAAVLAGACAGFLPHNFQPARIFMGDSGSMLIGLMLAAATTSASGRITYADSAPRNALGAARADRRRRRGRARPVARPVARRRTPDPCRAQPVRARQDAPAPPAARDRALATACGPAHLPVGRGVRVRRSRARAHHRRLPRGGGRGRRTADRGARLGGPPTAGPVIVPDGPVRSPRGR